MMFPLARDMSALSNPSCNGAALQFCAVLTQNPVVTKSEGPRQVPT